MGRDKIAVLGGIALIGLTWWVFKSPSEGASESSWCYMSVQLIESSAGISKHTFREGSCSLLKVSENARLVTGTYTTPVTVRNHADPLPYEALMARRGDMYFLCEVKVGDEPSRERMNRRDECWAAAGELARLKR